MGLFAFVFGIDSLAMMIGFFALLPVGLYTGGTVIRYEPGPKELVVDVMTQPGANCLDAHDSEEQLNMAALAPAFSPEFYTWTFPGCPIQIRVRVKIVDALQRLVERAQDPGTLAPFAGGLLLGDTASPGVTEVTTSNHWRGSMLRLSKPRSEKPNAKSLVSFGRYPATRPSPAPACG